MEDDSDSLSDTEFLYSDSQPFGSVQKFNKQSPQKSILAKTPELVKEETSSHKVSIASSSSSDSAE
jgi:hypothetical protein